MALDDFLDDSGILALFGAVSQQVGSGELGEILAHPVDAAAAALKQLNDVVKRELTARERSGMMEALAAAESLLRDVLLVSEGTALPIVNADASEVVDRIASSTCTKGVLKALDAISEAEGWLARNVTPQLALEAMLLQIKEALACPPSYR